MEKERVDLLAVLIEPDALQETKIRGGRAHGSEFALHVTDERTRARRAGIGRKKLGCGIHTLASASILSTSASR